MMLRKYFISLKEGTTCNAVELAGVDGKEVSFLTVIRKRKQQLDVVEKKAVSPDEPLLKLLKKHTPVFLVINTGQVLTKIVPSSAKDDAAVVNQAFPAIKINDFYYELMISGASTIISVCRKDYADGIIEKYAENNLHIAAFSLGVSSIGQITGFVDKTDTLALSNTKIQLQDHHIKTLEKSEEHKTRAYTINGIALEGNYLLGFSAILGHVLKNNGNTSNFNPANTAFLADFYGRRFFHFFLRSGLGVILLMLVINFFVFNFYYSKTTMLQENSAIKSADKKQVAALRKRVDNKQQRTAIILANAASKSALYLNEFITVLPASVLLNEMIYQPLAKPIKEDDRIKVVQRGIKITGTSKDSDTFSNWIETLEKQDWITHVKIQDYDYSSPSTSVFTIQITLKDEH